jgi:spore coat protein U-like protein
MFVRVCIAAFGAAALCGQADAQTRTATFAVRAVVEARCSVTAVNVNADSLTRPAAPASTVTAHCSDGTPYAIGLDRGAGTGDAAGQPAVAGRGSGAPQTFAVFGKSPAGQVASAAADAGVVRVTVTF